MNTLLKWAVGGLIAGYAVFMIGKGTLDRDGKFLGLVDEVEGTFGLDDIAKGLVVGGALYFGGHLVHKFGLPAPTVS